MLVRRAFAASLAVVALLLASAFPNAASRTLPAAGPTALDTFLRGQITAGGESEIVLLGDYNEIVTEPEGRDVLAPLLTAPEQYTVRTEPAAVAGGGKLVNLVVR